MSNSPNFSCFLCGRSGYTQRQGHARDNASLKPLECTNCGMVQLSSIDHIDSCYYENGHMHDSQPVSIEAELAQSQTDTTRRLAQFKHLITDKRVLDIGCGAGSFLMAADNCAREVAGVEPEERFQKHLTEQKLTVYKSIHDIPTSTEYDVTTLFHVLEHIKVTCPQKTGPPKKLV